LESLTPATLAVSLSAASGRTVTVGYSVNGGSATGGGVDYTLAAGTLTFAPGVTTQNISLTVVNDTADEIDETVPVTLSNATNATLGAISTHTYTILDDDPLPSLAINNVIVIEGNSGTTNAPLSAGTGTGAITAADLPPPVTLSLTGSPMAEAGRVATVTATHSAVSRPTGTATPALSRTASLASAGTASAAASVITRSR